MGEGKDEWEVPHWASPPHPGCGRKTLVLESGGATSRHDISDRAFYILGREPSTVDVSLQAEKTSRRHAAICHNAEGETFLVDLKSTNGTRLDGHKLIPLTFSPWSNQIAVFGPEDDGFVTVRLETRQRGVKRGCEEPSGRNVCLRTGPKAENSSLSKNGVCDKCDGKHPTSACPHFKKPRENHKDAWANYGKGALHVMGSGGGNFVLRNAKLVKQPADGSCLFHSLCVGLANRDAEGLRRELARFVAQNPHVEISGDTIEEWVRWDANTSCALYARRMERSGWGGGIEMAVCSLLKKVNVHVYERYERSHGDFLRISCFDDPEARKTVHVLYQGGVHFDALLPGRG